ncbi:unnamed protein product [Caenorhabditis brenneri]
MELTFLTASHVFENRYFMLTKNDKHGFYWGKFRKIWRILGYFGCFLASLPIYFGIPEDQETAKRGVIEKLPCLPESVRRLPIFVMETVLSIDSNRSDFNYRNDGFPDGLDCFRMDF